MQELTATPPEYLKPRPYHQKRWEILNLSIPSTQKLIPSQMIIPVMEHVYLRAPEYAEPRSSNLNHEDITSLSSLPPKMHLNSGRLYDQTF